MPASNKLSFRKEERLCSRKLIDKLFCGGVSRSMTAFPLRAIYLLIEEGTEEGKVQVLVSVPKKQLKLAVKRNRVKRQVREAYRRNKQILFDKLNHRNPVENPSTTSPSPDKILSSCYLTLHSALLPIRAHMF